MKILQLNSDWKWTGPAEPMLLLLRALRELGHEVELACPEPPADADRSLAEEARAAGIAPLLSLERSRGVHPWRDRRDLRVLHGLLRARDFDLLHTWHTRDHVLALRAAGLRRRGQGARVVRTLATGEPIGAAPWSRWLFGSGCDGLHCVSPGLAERSRSLRAGRPLLGAFGAVDLERFAPAAENSGSTRSQLGLGPEHRVIGVVARVQPHRRFELLFEALALIADSHPELRLLVLGRGTHFDEVARRPVECLGLQKQVIFAGYRADDYPAILREMELLTFLVPGSDGSCRAVLEAAACGVPAVATRRGALPEIVEEGATGILVDERAEAIADSWRTLLADSERLRLMGERARRRALEHFDPERLASDLVSLYQACLDEARASGARPAGA